MLIDLTIKPKLIDKIQITDQNGNLLPHELKKTRFNFFSSLMSDFTQPTPNKDYNIEKFLQLIKWTIRDLINNPKYVWLSLNYSYQITIINSDRWKFPIKIQLSDGAGKLWISRQAFLMGIWPTEIDPKLEYDRIRNPYEFDLLVHQVISSSFYDYLFETIDGPNTRCDIRNYANKYKVLNQSIIKHAKLVQNDTHLLSDDFPLQKQENSKQLSFVSPQGVLKSLRTFKKLPQIHEGIFIGSSLSWYHFVAECATRLTKIPPKYLNGIPVIIERNAPDSIIEFLKLATGVEPIQVGYLEEIQVEKLHTVTKNFLKFGQFDKIALYNLRKHLNSKLNFEKNTPFRNVYLKRPDKIFRPMHNERDLIKKLSIYNFEVYQPELMTFRQQVELISSAKVLIAESGAALTNLLFANSNSHFIEIHPGTNDYPDFWRNYANLFTTNYSKLQGDKVLLGKRGIARDGFKVNLFRIEKLLYELESN